MAQTNKNLDLNGKYLTIFGKTGWKVSETTWCIPSIFGINAEIDAEETASGFEKLIQQDKDGGDFKKIDHIHTSIVLGICLFCEGVISSQMVEKAEITDEYISFPNVEFKNGTFPVRIYKKNKHDRATIDSSGNVV